MAITLGSAYPPKLVMIEAGTTARAVNPSLILHIAQAGAGCAIVFVNGETLTFKGDLVDLLKQLNA